MRFGAWEHVKRVDTRARILADRHYSRQTIGHREFMPPGRTFVLIVRSDSAPCGASAVWGVCENLGMDGVRRWRVTIFRNEASGMLSSELVRQATDATFTRWVVHYGDLPPCRLTTEIDTRKTRRKRDPGRCFRRAGWEEIGRSSDSGLVVLAAP